jgi:uncharacterized membrane protein YfcA
MGSRPRMLPAMSWLIVFYILTGLVAGFVDSIAGGGGLITVPALTLTLGAGSVAIGTNKIAGSCAALVALCLYLHGGHAKARGNVLFTILVGLSAAAGAFVSPYIPVTVYQRMLIVVVPLFLWVVLKKEIWQKQLVSPSSESRPRLLLASAFVCGFYDGIAGPGAGTLMFLALLLLAKLPLMTAIATAKFANLTSALVALASYSYLGQVRWLDGLPLAFAISLGAYAGSSMTSRRARADHSSEKASKIARLALFFVSSLLLIRLIFSFHWSKG